MSDQQWPHVRHIYACLDMIGQLKHFSLSPCASLQGEVDIKYVNETVFDAERKEGRTAAIKIACDMAKLEAERDRLREAIEQAPHRDGCEIVDYGKACNCWKRAALAEGEAK